MALAFAKLLIVALSTLTSYASIVLFKGTAVLIVLVLRLVLLPGCLVSLFLCAVRAGTVKILSAACAAVAGALALAMDSAASACGAAVSSNSAAVKAVVEVARGRPEALLSATVELSEYAWEVAKNTVWNSTETFFDAVRYVIKHA